MLRALIIAVVGVIPSLALILWIERRAQQVIGAPLARWQRLLIPLPVVLTLARYVTPMLISRAFRIPWGSIAHNGFIAWGFSISPFVVMLLVAGLPFLLTASVKRGVHLVPSVWAGHALWVFFPFAPWLLFIGC